MIIDIILVLFVIAMAYMGKRRGFVKTLLGFLSTFISAVLSYFLTPLVVGALKPTAFYGNLTDNITKGIAENKINDATALPDAISDAVKGAGDKASEILAEHIAAVVVGIVIFFILLVLLKVLMVLLSDVFKLPVLKQVNSAGGFVSGLLLSLAVLYICFAIWGCVTAFQLPEPLKDTQLAKSMFENNLLLIFFVH